MAENREHLEGLLEIIKTLIAQDENNWFKNELIALTKKNELGNTDLKEAPALFGTINENVNTIHKYLMLDIIPMIDYSAVGNKKVQDQLFRDCLEMGRYRLGKINDLIDYDEFCKYAHLQAEELINYFYSKKNSGDIDKIVKHINKYNTKYSPTRIPSKIEQIDYTYKVFAIKTQLGIESSTQTILLKIRDVRNDLSHRSTFTKNSEDDILNEYNKNMYSKIKYADRDKMGIKSVCENAELIIFRRKSDFDGVYMTLENLKSKILSAF